MSSTSPLSATNPNRLLREVEAAGYVGFAQKTLQRRRWAGLPPSFTKIGSNVRYSVADLDAFLASGRIER